MAATKLNVHVYLLENVNLNHQTLKQWLVINPDFEQQNYLKIYNVRKKGLQRIFYMLLGIAEISLIYVLLKFKVTYKIFISF